MYIERWFLARLALLAGLGPPLPRHLAPTSMPLAGHVTRLLARLPGGGREVLDELLPMVYEELQRVAHRQLRRERLDHTLDTAALEQPSEAGKYHSASLTNRQRLGDRRGEGWMLASLASLHRRRGAAEEARRLARRAAEIVAECGDAELREACERITPLAGR